MKTTQTSNVPTFYNELNSLYDDSEPNSGINPKDDALSSIPIFTIKD